MLLSQKTIDNVQSAINTGSFVTDAIRLVAIYSTKSLTLALYHLGEKQVVSELNPVVGSKLGDLILNAAAFSDFYLLEEIYSGLEKDNVAEKVLEIWPNKDGKKVVSIVDTVPPVSADKLASLAMRFNRHRK